MSVVDLVLSPIAALKRRFDEMRLERRWRRLKALGMHIGTGVNLPAQAMREQISAALDVVVNVTRMADGTRRVVGISEIVGMELEVVAMQDIFVFRKSGIAEDGRVVGQYIATGIRPKFADRLAVSGVPLSAELFREGRVL